MNKSAGTICAIAVLLALASPVEARTGPVLASIPSTSMFYDANFALGVAAAAKNRPAADVRAIIVPHHLLAATYAARMFRLASGRAIDTVFIIGPNHFNVGPTTIATAEAVWQTPLGAVTTDGGLVDRLGSALRIRPASFVFTNEHSVGSVVPYVARYFLKAKIVPVALSSYAGIGEAKQLAKWLSANANDRSLVVFSIDFSHYLTEEQADRKDAVTRRLIERRDIDAISRLNNDNVDSPASLMTALEYGKLTGLRTEIVANGNSNRVRPEKTASTTSYFAVAFRKR